MQSSDSDKWSMGLEGVKVDLRRAVIGGCLSGIVILIGGWLVGEASSAEAYQLFKTVLPNIRSFCSTILLALGTILALMLTLLSLSANIDINIKWEHYQRVKQIAWIDTVTLIITTLVYLLMNIPIVESDAASIRWYTYIYYTTSIIAALLGGAFIIVVLLLYNTIRDMIDFLDPKNEHRLRNTEEEKKKEEQD